MEASLGPESLNRIIAISKLCYKFSITFTLTRPLRKKPTTPTPQIFDAHLLEEIEEKKRCLFTLANL